MTPRPSQITTREFIARVYGGLDGFVEVRTVPVVERLFVPIHDPAAVEEFAERHANRNLHVGVAARTGNHDGSLAGCGALPALFADLDFKDFDADTDVRRMLDTAALPPSVVISTGGGFHAWWLLDQPLDLQQRATDAKALLRRLARQLRADMASAEPARVLRLPNTLNFKYEPARPVQIAMFDPARRYPVQAFDDWLPKGTHVPRAVVDSSAVIPQGSRNAHLTSLAGTMRRRGMAEPSIEAALVTENATRCRPVLPDEEVHHIVRSVARYAPEPDSQPLVFADPLPDLLARAVNVQEPRWLVHGLIPGDGIVMLHSQPREFKTLIAQALLVAVTTGIPAFGLERLHVGEPVPAWYITEEDGWWRVTDRFRALVQGYGLVRAPQLLDVSAGKGMNLDDAEWQDRIITTARDRGHRLIALDPLRSLTDNADQGPRELKPVARFLRHLIRETGAVVQINHHDAKPPATAHDARRRPQRASGGGIFSIADAPIHVERLDDTQRLLVPSAFKFAADPRPVAVRLESGDGWLRLVGGEPTDASGDAAALDTRILEFLKHSPYSYGSAVARGVHAAKAHVLERLKVLADGGFVDAVQEGKGIKWFWRRAS